jgi:hypothetical protein
MAEPKKTRPSAPRRAARALQPPRLPDEKEIATRAYQLFVARGGEHGRDLDDWLRAKQELLSSNA